MGLKQKLGEAKDRITGKKEQKTIPTRLEELGLSFMASEETKDRIETKKQLFKLLYSPLRGTTPEAKVKSLYKKIHQVNEILHEVDIPYGRGGERSWYGEVAFSWTNILAISETFIESTMRQMKTLEHLKELKEGKKHPISLERIRHRKENLLVNIEHFFVRITRSYAEKVSSVSWFPEDVGRNWAVIINTMKGDSRGDVRKWEPE